MHSKIKEMLNTSPFWDRIPIPGQALNACENHRNAEYIFHVQWISDASSKAKRIQQEGNPKYMSHVGWNSYAGSKIECI
jgi:hypothetical protein